MGDTKSGVLIGTDGYGNKYYENMEDLPRALNPHLPYPLPPSPRTRLTIRDSADAVGRLQGQVLYAVSPFPSPPLVAYLPSTPQSDSCRDQIEPGWHAWISYMVDTPPTKDPILQRKIRVWEPKEHRPGLTATRSAYKPYSTTKNKYSAWTPVAAPR